MAEENKVAKVGEVKPEVKKVVDQAEAEAKRATEVISQKTVVKTPTVSPEPVSVEDAKKAEETEKIKKEMEQVEAPKVPIASDEKVVITVGPDEVPEDKKQEVDSKEATKEKAIEEVAEADKKLEEAKQKVEEKFALPFKIEDPSEFKEKKRMTIMVYGESGVGKTTFAGTAQDVPEMKNCINIDAESGHKVLAYRGDIPRIPIENYHQFANVYEFFRAYCYHRDQGNTKRLCELEAMARRVDHVEKPHIFNTLIIDSLTEIQKYCMYQILGIDTNKRKLDVQPDSPEWQDWGASYEMVQLLIRYFRDLPINVILVAGAQRSEITLLGKKVLMFEPMLPGKLASGVQYFLDHLGYYWTYTSDSGEVVRRLYFQPGITYRAKNRFLNLKGNYIQDPTMAKMFVLEQH